MGYIEAIQAWPQTLLDWITVISTICGGLWALQSFWKSNEIKAAEMLVKLEESFALVHPTLLEIESKTVYLRKYEPALNKLKAKEELDIAENEAINAIEKTFRHFFTSWNVRQRTHQETLDAAYSYYLKLLCGDERAKLRDYALEYWGKVYRWARTVRKPWPIRMWLTLKFMGSDSVKWVESLREW